MKFSLVWDRRAKDVYAALKRKAEASLAVREKSRHKKASRDEGLFKQVRKCLELLQQNPRHPGLQTHEFSAIPNPYQKGQKVFEAYVQQKTPGAYRIFWCYGPRQEEITIIAITPHP
ncbi:MAG: hypothetical protein HY913_10670 [Desulfomonile tiedjei]|nr:hypothetical protein [Desulfomonile tiedjei]